jgi:hypothetical protein
VNQPILWGFAGFGQTNVLAQESKPQLDALQPVRVRMGQAPQIGVEGDPGGPFRVGLAVRGRLVSLALLPVLLGAASVHAANGWVFTASGGWEYPAFLVVASLIHPLLGDGAHALAFESKMPCPAAVYGIPGLTLGDVPLAYFGLVRYEAAGLADELIPVSRRAKELLPGYLAFRRELTGG